MEPNGTLPPTLTDLLTNNLILRHISPYLPLRSLLALSASSRTLHSLIVRQPDSWRYIDLSFLRSSFSDLDSSPLDSGGISWRAERMDEALTEDDFYSGPLRGVFGKLQSKGWLRNVQILVLDGLSVPADLVREILAEERFNVKILSLREAKHLNLSKLQQVLRYMVRPTRAEGSLKLKALYVFGAKEMGTLPFSQQRLEGSQPVVRTGGVMAAEGAQIGAEWNARSSEALGESLGCDEETKWYSPTGRVLKRPQSDWPETLRACRGLITFDAVLCRGPRHDITKVDSKDFLQPAIAVVALGGHGCEVCHSCPEGPAVFGQSEEWHLPLLGPAPTHSATVRAAQCPRLRGPQGDMPRLILRCEECLRGRWCERCNRWWCEDCYDTSTDSRQAGWMAGDNTTLKAVKVYSNSCVEHCLVSEMMSGAGSNGMWG